MEREELELFIDLRRDYGDAAEITFDRRYPGDRRRSYEKPLEERRRGNRRTHDISHNLVMYGWAMIRPDAGETAATSG